MTYYKAFNKDMTCRGMQYEVGKVFCAQGEKEEVCTDGVLHFCGNLLNLLRYSGYNEPDCRICEVEPLSEVVSSVAGKVCGARCLKICKDIGSWSAVMKSAVHGWIRISKKDMRVLSSGASIYQLIDIPKSQSLFEGGLKFPADGYAIVLGQVRDYLRCRDLTTTEIPIGGECFVFAPVLGSYWYDAVDYGFVMSPDGHLTTGSNTRHLDGCILDDKFTVYSTLEEAKEMADANTCCVTFPLSPKDGTVLFYDSDNVFQWDGGMWVRMVHGSDSPEFGLHDYVYPASKTGEGSDA